MSEDKRLIHLEETIKLMSDKATPQERNQVLLKQTIRAIKAIRKDVVGKIDSEIEFMEANLIHANDIVFK